MPLEPPRAQATTNPVLSGSFPQKRSAKIVGMADQPRRAHRYVAALSVGALSLSILAVAVTWPIYNSKHVDAQQAAEGVDAPVSTDAIGPLWGPVPASLPIKAETERKDKKLPEMDSAIVELEKEPEASLPSGDTTGSLDAAQPASHEVRTRLQRSRIQHRAPTRTIASSIAKYHEVPDWSAKMYDGNWQPKAFAFQH
jgi:hypothetical protein